MQHLENGWYCAGLSADLQAVKTRAIKIINEQLLLFRGKNGFFTLQDQCTHRFTPLSKGKLCDARIACVYHGLQFDEYGMSVHTPNGPVPHHAAVRAYPALERYAALRLGMEEPDLANPALLPHFSIAKERLGWSYIQGYLHIRANYQLVTDDLLDLTHVPFLHSFFASSGSTPKGFEAHIATSRQRNTVYTIDELRYTPTSELYRMIWERGEPPASCATRATMLWDPPSLLLLDTGATVVDGEKDAGPSLSQAHWLTRETADTTGYFWAVAAVALSAMRRCPHN